MKKIGLVLVVMGMLVNGRVNGQAPSWVWARTATGLIDAAPVATDHSGNVYISGNFEGTVYFGSTSITSSSTTSDNSFLAKYDSLGNFLWVMQSTSLVTGGAICTDNLNNILVAAYFGGGPLGSFGPVSLTGAAAGSFTLIKFDTNGNFIWMKSSNQGPALITGIATDANNDVCITGWSGNSPLIIATDTFSFPHPGYCVFIAKFDQSGNYMWSKVGKPTSLVDYPRSSGIAIDGFGNEYITGYDKSAMVFGTDTIPNGTLSSHIYLVKFSPSGNFLWGRKSDGNYNEASNSVAVNSFGKVFITGYSNSTILYFDTITIASTDINLHSFIAEYNSSGDIEWVKKSTTPNQAYSAAADNYGNVLIAGSMQIYPITFGAYTIPCPDTTNYDNSFIMKFNSAGIAVWGTSIEGGGDDAMDITFDNSNHLYVCGDFENTGGNSLVFSNDTLYSTGGESLFLAKLYYTQDLAVNEISKPSPTITLFPNPTSTSFTITSTDKIESVRVFNLPGEEVLTITPNNTQSTINIIQFSKGIYFAEIKTDKGTERKKVVKE